MLDSRTLLLSWRSLAVVGLLNGLPETPLWAQDRQGPNPSFLREAAESAELTTETEPTASSAAQTNPQRGLPLRGSQPEHRGFKNPSQNTNSESSLSAGRKLELDSGPPLTMEELATIRRTIPPHVATQMAEARDAFRRGLMPLSDYRTHWDVAAVTAERLSQVVGFPRSFERMVVNHTARLESDLAEMVALNQPAATGSQADQILVQLWRHDLQRQIQRSRQPGKLVPPTAEEARLAREQWRLRSAEFSLGTASLTDLDQAGAWLAATEANGPSSVSQYASLLEETLQARQKFAQAGAGLGRSDLVALAQFSRAQQSIAGTTTPEETTRAIQQAWTAAEAAFDEQVAFHQRGTASLFDVAASWNLRSSLFDRAQQRDLTVAPDRRNRLSDDLNRLQAMAAAVGDLRGRNAADVAMVQTLSDRQRLRILTTADSGNNRDGAPQIEKP